MNTTKLVVEIPFGPEFFSGLISTTSSVVFIAVKISYIRFFTAVHICDFYISTIIMSKRDNRSNALATGSCATLLPYCSIICYL